MGALPSMSRFGDEMKPVFRAMAWKPVDLELELGINPLIKPPRSELRLRGAGQKVLLKCVNGGDQRGA